MDTTDIHDEIERSFGAGPATRTTDALVDDLLTRGHGVVRRRRAALAVGSAAVLVAVVIGGTAALGGSPDATGRHTPVANNPGPTSPTATGPTAPTTPPPSRAEIARALHRGLVEYDGAGNLVVVPGATVLQRIRTPFDMQHWSRSVAMTVEFRGATYWYALAWDHDGSTADTHSWAGDQHGSLSAWVARLRDGTNGNGAGDASSAGGDAWPGIPDLEAVRFVGDTEQLEPVRGTTILEQRAHVQVGRSFARPTDQTAAAEVRTSDGTLYYVLARRFDGKTPQYIAVPQGFGGATLDDFLTVARQRYADGGGGLL